MVYQSQGTAIAGLVDGQRYYVINVSENGSYRYQLATSLQNAKDGIAIQLGATSGSGGVTLRKVVDKLDSGGGMISLDIGALTQGHGLTNSMLSITVAGAGGKSLGGAGAIGVNLSRTEVQAVIDNSSAAAGTQLRADAGRVSVSAQDSSRIVTATGALGISTTQGASAAIGASVGVADMQNGVRALIRGAQVTAQAVQVKRGRTRQHLQRLRRPGRRRRVAVSGSLAVNTIRTRCTRASRTDRRSRPPRATSASPPATRPASRRWPATCPVSVGGRVAAGMAFAVNRVFDTVYAGAVGSALSAAGDIVVQATFARPDDMPPGLDAQISTMAVSGAVAAGGSGANVGFGGSAVLNWIANTITAEIAGTASGQAVTAGGDLLVQARDASTINSLAGAVALGLAARAPASPWAPACRTTTWAARRWASRARIP